MDLICIILQLSPLFIDLLTTMFASSSRSKGITSHKCFPFYYVDEEHKIQLEADETEESDNMEEDDKHPCTCTLLALFYRVDDSSIEDKMANTVIITMFQSLRFKTLLGFAHISNLKQLLLKGYEESKYLHLGVQILTIPEISFVIFQNKELSK